ncbi:unnamed protein product [Brachionus calyciflorus]|uniref:Uncharacterized protein n=1 Tax=Brachionus calyciflorus TaxID=104777 RepID=A0A814L790_9BILA|nr:unnamed protein product [Brachionus calyciflorus]
MRNSLFEMKIKTFSFAFLIIFCQAKTQEWFTLIDNLNDPNAFFQDKTIEIYEFSTPSKLTCIQKCFYFDSSCQYFQHFKDKQICKIYTSIEKSYFHGRRNIYLREKKLPRIHFLNGLKFCLFLSNELNKTFLIQGSFLDQHQLVNMSFELNIDLASNGINLIGPFSFKKCLKIENLNLSNNSLKIIYSKSFNGMDNLKNLNLSFNQISHLESDVFKDVILLKNLDLDNNLISYLDENLLFYAPYLESLNLGWNIIEYIEQGAFKSLTKLIRLSLNDNRLKFLDPIFDNLVLLNFLNVYSNQISTIHNDTFKFLKKVFRVNIYNNQISVINSETFKGADNLAILTINNNKLDEIHKNLSINLPSLKDLTLSSNNLSFLELDFFNRFVNLEILRLYECVIREIDLSSLSKLKFLNLGNNEISYFSQNLSSLNTLILNSNPLVNLTYPLITSKNSSLQELDICRCQLKYIDLNLLTNLTYLKFLKIKANPIFLDDDFFNDFKSLESVYIDQNNAFRFKNLYSKINFFY